MKRQRGRGRPNKPGGGGGHQPNRTMESTGPDIKVRGPASHIYERYLQLARDASSAGDRVMAESYLQHAEHYFRLLRTMQPAMPPQQANADRFGNDSDYDGEEEGGEGADSEGGGESGGDQVEGEFAGQSPQPQQDFNRDDGFRRRRGRRNRFRTGGPDGEREGGEDEGRDAVSAGPREGVESEAPAERPAREPRPRRAPREPRDNAERPAETPEGFSSGPRPAFLGSGAD